MPNRIDATELFNIEVDELARILAFIAPDRLSRLLQPQSTQNTTELLYEALKDTLRLSETIPGEQHFLDPLTVPGPLPNLVEVSAVGNSIGIKIIWAPRLLAEQLRKS